MVWNGEEKRWKNGNKKGPQQRIATALSGVIICQTLCASYFRRRQKAVLVFFKTNTLSEDFVHLSAERCPFSKTLKTQFLQLFVRFLPELPPAQIPNFFALSGESYAGEVPCSSPVLFSSHCPFRGILRTRHSRSNPLLFPQH